MNTKNGNVRSKTLTIEVLKFALYVGATIVAVIVFVFGVQGSQDEKIRTNRASVELNAVRHEEHVDRAIDTFKKIDSTLDAQQKLMQQTREALVKVDVSQQQLVNEVKKLSEKVEGAKP